MIPAYIVAVVAAGALAIRLLPWSDQERADTVSGLRFLFRVWRGR